MSTDYMDHLGDLGGEGARCRVCSERCTSPDGPCEAAHEGRLDATDSAGHLTTEAEEIAGHQVPCCGSYLCAACLPPDYPDMPCPVCGGRA